MTKTETFRARLARLADAHAAARAAGQIVRGTMRVAEPSPEPADAVALRGEVERLRALLADILRNFHEKGHPGYPGIRTGWVRETTFAAWQLAARGLPVDALRRGGLAVLDGSNATVDDERYWCCPDHPAADVKQIRGAAVCQEPGCLQSTAVAGSDGAR